jgi:hypothetical protein
MHGLNLGKTSTPDNREASRTPPQYLVYVKEKKNLLVDLNTQKEPETEEEETGFDESLQEDLTSLEKKLSEHQKNQSKQSSDIKRYITKISISAAN